MDSGGFDRVLLIGNPRSGGGIARKWIERLAERLRKGGRQVDAMLTTRAGDAREAAAAAPDGTLVTAFGGDGTVNEVLNGIDPERHALAVVPAGTGNVLAKELGLSHHPPDAVRQLMAGRVVRLDVGVCNGRRFICVFGAGVDADVVRAVHARRGRSLSQLHYVPHVISALLTPTRWQIGVEVDGRTVAEDADQVAVGNTHSYGGPLEMTPTARPDNGRLDVMCVRLRHIGDALALTTRCLMRSVHKAKGIAYVYGQTVRVTSTRSEVPYEVDGEAAGYLPAEVTVEPAAVRLLVPRSFGGGWRGGEA